MHVHALCDVFTFTGKQPSIYVQMEQKHRPHYFKCCTLPARVHLLPGIRIYLACEDHRTHIHVFDYYSNQKYFCLVLCFGLFAEDFIRE